MTIQFNEIGDMVAPTGLDLVQIEQRGDLVVLYTHKNQHGMVRNETAVFRGEIKPLCELLAACRHHGSVLMAYIA